MTRNNDYGAHHIKVNIFRVFRVMHIILKNLIGLPVLIILII